MVLATWLEENGPDLLMASLLLLILALLWALRLRLQLLEKSMHLRQHSEAEKQFERLYTELVEHASDVIFRLDAQGKIVAMNQAGQDLLGYPRSVLLGKRIADLFPADRISGLSQFDGSQEYAAGELTLLNHEQKPVFLELSLRRERAHGQTKSIEVIARNVTERRRLEAKVRQSERMQAMGLLAGGVAHDFNNYLTVILNFAELAVEAGPSPEIKNMLEEIRKAGLSAAGMSRQMLDFSRRQTLTPRALNLNQVVTNLQSMLQSALGKKIELKLQLTTGLPNIIADLGSIEQVLLNLAFNARDAMPQGGTLRIRTIPKESERRVLLEVSDTGHGMDEATRNKIFEPFFTTKEPGKGSGLGLAAVQRIVQKSGGRITVESEPGQGTTFRLDFPAA
jgi:two-component system cell cycle sensor histidine kinase/response regulator CckA